MEKAFRVLVIALRESLSYFRFIIVLHLISSHLILKMIFLILDKGDTFGINGTFGAPEKKLVLILLKQGQNFV